jgi:hypothetical protein
MWLLDQEEEITVSCLTELIDLVDHTHALNATLIAQARFRRILAAGTLGGLAVWLSPVEGNPLEVVVWFFGIALLWVGVSAFVISDSYATPEIIRMLMRLNVRNRSAYARLRKRLAVANRLSLTEVREYLRLESLARETERQAIQVLPLDDLRGASLGIRGNARY